MHRSLHRHHHLPDGYASSEAPQHVSCCLHHAALLRAGRVHVDADGRGVHVPSFCQGLAAQGEWRYHQMLCSSMG